MDKTLAAYRNKNLTEGLQSSQSQKNQETETALETTSQSGNLLHHLRQQLYSLSPAEKLIGQYILEQPTQVLHLAMDQLAKRVGVSQGTLANFCHSLGYSGFKEFKIMLAAEVNSPLQLVHSSVLPGDNLQQITAKAISSNIDALITTLNGVDLGEIEKAIEAISLAHRLELYGFGVSSAVALDAFSRFLHIGLAVNWLSDNSLQIASAALLSAEDVVIGISYSGETHGVVQAFSKARASGATTIAISSDPYSPLVRLANIKLVVTPREPTTFRNINISSRIAMLTIIDIIYLGLINLLGETAIEKIQLTNLAENEIKK
jgi:RpiR family carbohydrate utilization transcriptional regulator